MSFLTVSVIDARLTFAAWRLPLRWSRWGPWGVAVAPPISPYTGPGWSPPFCRVPLVLPSVFYILLCAFPPVFMAIFWSVSLTPACPLRATPLWGCSLDICAVLCYGHDCRVLLTTAIDILWRWPCLPRYGGSDPLLLRYAWWSSRCLEAGLTSRPLLALPGLCLMPDLLSRQPDPEASSNRHSVALALSSSL